VTGFGIAFVVRGWIVEEAPLLPIRHDSLDYQFTNPLLLINVVSKNLFSNKEIEKSFQTYIRKIKKEDVSSVSVYFHDLNSSTWTGVNEDMVYAPSSMLKVIIMLAYLYNPSFLNEQIYYKQSAE